MSGLRWLRRRLVLSAVSVLATFEFLVSLPPLRHVSVMAEVLYMVERKEDISLSGLRWLRRPSGLSMVSVLSPFEPRASQPPLLPASAAVITRFCDGVPFDVCVASCSAAETLGGGAICG